MSAPTGLVVSLRPAAYRVAARLGLSPGTDWTRAAAERRVHAPATELPSRPAICLPDEELRATGTMHSSTLAAERRSVHANTGQHGATVLYRFDDALIADGCWYAGGAYTILRPAVRKPIVVASAPRIDEAVLCTDMGSQLYFGHWLCDALCTELLAEDLGLAPVTVKRPHWGHEDGYRTLTGLSATELSVARVRRLWVVDDRGYNPQRVERFQRLRTRIRTGAPPAAGKRVFIDRGASGVARRLVNRDAVLDALVRDGFTIVEPERMTPRQVVDALAEATLAVGVEGSHLNHALLALPEGAGLIAIQPPDRFNMGNKFIAEFASLRFGFVVADAHDDGFVLDPGRLSRTVDLF